MSPSPAQSITRNPQQRLILAIAITASFVAFFDMSVVNVALPAIVDQLGIGSAVNNAIARVAGLVAVLLALGGVASWVGVRNPAAPVTDSQVSLREEFSKPSSGFADFWCSLGGGRGPVNPPLDRVAPAFPHNA